mmetsp:Transcript_102935/g.320777  ORF Transcript_102935/g.320777 Transcript_102935/m.320777 type:complete len:332 (-) Transcript_102935:17-1012(-)
MWKLGVVAAACVAGLSGLPFALLAYDPYFVDRLRPYFPGSVVKLRLRLEAGDPTVPLYRSVFWAKDRPACAATLLERARHSCGGRCDIVFVGDSIVDSLTGGNCYEPEVMVQSLRRPLLEELPARWRPLVLAAGGDQTQHTLWHLRRCVPVLKPPRVFVLMLGSNNLALQGSMTPEDTVRGLGAVVQALRAAHPRAPVLLHSILPRANDQALFQKDPRKFFQVKIDKANGLLPGLARRTPGVFHVDCTRVFPRGIGRDARAVLPDLIHPNAEGYRRWLRCMVPILGRALNATAGKASWAGSAAGGDLSRQRESARACMRGCVRVRMRVPVQ